MTALVEETIGGKQHAKVCEQPAEQNMTSNVNIVPAEQEEYDKPEETTDNEDKDYVPVGGEQ